MFKVLWNGRESVRFSHEKCRSSKKIRVPKGANVQYDDYMKDPPSKKVTCKGKYR